MPLLAIEVNLESFFDVNLITFTILAFGFSVIVTSTLVLILRPLTVKAKIRKGAHPEKMNLVYLRLIIYILAEFIAFILDIFLVIFGKNYNIPVFTIILFLIIVIYKLIHVLFKNYKDLGFDSKGIIDSVKTVNKIIKDKNLDVIQGHEEDNIDKRSNNIKRGNR